MNEIIRTKDIGVMTESRIAIYAQASGDLNPIHLDGDFARSCGYPSVIAHGMLSAGLLASVVASWMPNGFIRQFSTRFHRVVQPGMHLTARGSLREEQSKNGLRRFSLSVQLNSGDTVFATATAMVVVDSLEQY